MIFLLCQSKYSKADLTASPLSDNQSAQIDLLVQNLLCQRLGIQTKFWAQHEIIATERLRRVTYSCF